VDPYNADMNGDSS